MNTEERGEQASLYALGLLEGDELIAFQRALNQDPALEALVRELQAASNLLARTLPKVRAPAALKASILRQTVPPDPVPEPVREPREAISFEWMQWIPWGLAAALTLGCGILWFGKSALSDRVARLTKENGSLQLRLAGLESERNRLEVRINGLESEKGDLKIRVASLENRDALTDVQNVVLAPQPGVPANSEVTAVWDQRRQAGVLDLTKLPPPPDDMSYQLWIITADSPKPVNVGLLAATGQRAAFRAPQPVGQVAALAISLEPCGGSPAPTKVVYLGRM